jgi:anti-sigma factor (TIGR02949 family)
MSRFAMFPKSHRMMTCRRVGEKLQAYLDGEVDDLTTRRIAHHLEDCRRCGMELDVYTQIKASLQRRGNAADEDALQRLRSFSEQLASTPDPGSEEAGEAPSG